MKLEITTNIENGVFKRNRSLVLKAIQSFEGKTVVISIEKIKKKRSNLQNNFYWGLAIPLIQQGLLDATGELRTAKDIHYKILLPLFAPVNEIVNRDTGESLIERLTSSELTTTQFMDYMMEVKKWSADFLGIDIPDPKEQLSLQLDDD